MLQASVENYDLVPVFTTQAQTSSMLKDAAVLLGQRQLLLEGLLLASKQGCAVRAMVSANTGRGCAPCYLCCRGQGCMVIC